MQKTVTVVIVCIAAVFFLFSAVRYNVSVDTYNQTDPQQIIVIDAGHGGEDGGTSSASGLRESDLNLDISLRMEQVLALCGMKPYMIRSSDISVYSPGCETLSEKKVSDLKNRVQLINSMDDPIVVSIHQNHFPQERYSGSQVFYADTGNSASLAQTVQAALRDTLNPANNRSIKKTDSVYLMNHINCTGILVECGFLSNSQEVLLLQSAAYQKKLVCAIASALTGYVEGSLHHEV